MAASMTGYGRAEIEDSGLKFSTEINTVNNRFLEYQIRLPKSLMQLENNIKNLLGNKFNRGKVMVTVNLEQEQAEGAIMLDEPRADAYFRIYQLLKERYSLKGDLSMHDFASLPDLVKVEKQEEDLERIWNIMKRAVEKAADATCAMRTAEGANLVRDMLARVAEIRKTTGEIEALAGQNIKLYQDRLKSRIGELLQGAEVDEQRIAIEVALWADKSDITEECVRLKSHLEQFESSLTESGPVGKRLNFILQELNRETNTIGDKSAFYEISRRVINVKEEIERLREQVQNIE
ncbi:MAG TPA: YicC family protein [candidate division Zixibacteria bacterium]|jgi:uncharacterized protein (TIGR00255 family)|nr:YicC family protein [candidate division Zixibacteria bacterium]HBZ00815.1 YicC family protein [candidate division Zixibacteria bacterium]